MHMAGGGMHWGGGGMHVHPVTPVHPPWVRHWRDTFQFCSITHPSNGNSFPRDGREGGGSCGLSSHPAL
jgi:hypothetical protein